MTSREEVGRILAGVPEKHSRILYFGALLSRESATEIVIVGGSAIEIYTRGRYVSGDIDVRAEREPVHRVLTQWGFRDRGRLWTHDDWKLAVDVVGDRYSGDPYRITTIATPYGPIGLAVVEDLFVKRLAAAKHWQAREALDEASLLWAGYHDKVDWEYLDRKAREYQVQDLLSEFLKRVPRPG